MIQKLTLPIGALLMAATLAFGAMALLPTEAEAVQCFCPPGNNQTTHAWAMGHATCAQAKNACAGLVGNQARSHCSSTFGTQVCSWGPVTYVQPSCVQDANGTFKVDCDQTYACKRCLDF